MVIRTTAFRRAVATSLVVLVGGASAVVAGCGGSASQTLGLSSDSGKSSSTVSTSAERSTTTAERSKPARAGASASTAPSRSATSSSARRRETATSTARQRASFLARTGTAFGTFHRYVYAPFTAGSLTGSRGRAALAKAQAAVLSLSREVSKAKGAAEGSAALRKLFVPLAALQASAGTLAAHLARGRTDSVDIESINRAITNIKVIGLSSGVHIIERLPATAP